MRPVETEAEVVIRAPREAVFDRVAPIDLAAVFRGYGPLPAVTGVSRQVGAWDAVGQTRTVHLSDGGSIRERLDVYDRPEAFAYDVTEITGPLRFVASASRGAWTFEEMPGGTRVVWRYAFVPRAAWARPLLAAALRPLWQRYMRAALVAVRDHVEHDLGGSVERA